MTMLMPKNGPAVLKAAMKPAGRLTRAFVATGDVRSPLIAVWTLMSEPADDCELAWPTAWKSLLRWAVIPCS